jgi:hypothetical protein
LKTLGINLAVFLAWSSLVPAQSNPPAFTKGTWQAVTTAPGNLGPCLVLLDATVACNNSQDNTNLWWRLTPTTDGRYVNGTWSALPSFPQGYLPIYFSTQVLPTGQVIASGGEYLNGTATWTNKGALLDAHQTAWVECDSPVIPSGQLGDSQSITLPDGTFMNANITNTQVEKLAPPYTCTNGVGAFTLVSPTGKPDRNDEEGWTLLGDFAYVNGVLTATHFPRGILTVDAIAEPATQVMQGPAYNAWTGSGNTTADLEDSGSQELGPMVLRPDGTVLAVGATVHNSIYDSVNNVWKAAPDSPGGNDSADGPAALLPNGNVLLQLSPGVFNSPSTFYEFDFVTNTHNLTNAPPNAAGDSSFVGHLVVLPTGQILFTDFSTDAEIYTPSAANGTYAPAWRPTISSVATTLFAGSTNNPISGTQFNGLSFGGTYGDDLQVSTNYPLVRFTQVYANSLPQPTRITYGRTHNHSTMAVATGTATVSTQFDIPASLTPTVYCLQVVANGIPSSCTFVSVKAGQNN